MSQSCTVFGCTNTFDKAKRLSGPKIHFYCYPGRPWEKEKLKVWINFANRVTKDLKPWAPSKHSRICSAHFLGNEKSNDPKSASFNPTIHPVIEKSTSKKSQASLECPNAAVKRVLDKTKCIICGTFSVNKSSSKRPTPSSIIKANIFKTWKNDCAKATCEVLLNDKSGHFVKYFQEAEYCSLCEQLVRDICFTWKQLKFFQKAIDNLKDRMYELVHLNYQQIPEKCNLKVMEKRTSSYLSKTLHDAMPKFSHDEFLQMLYTVVKKCLQKPSNNTKSVDYCEVKPEADSDVEIYSEPAEYSSLESNSRNPKNNSDKTTSGSTEASPDATNECTETLGASEGEETGYTLVEITSDNEDESTEENVVVVIDQPNPLPVKSDVKKHHSIKSRNNPEDQHPYKCSICDKTFSCGRFLKFHHLKMHEEEKNLLFKCSFCDKRFGLENWLVVHIRESHKKEKPRESCEFCDKTFETSTGLKSHIRAHKKDQFKCTVCDKSFKSSLQRSAHEHLHSHDQELQSKCQEKIDDKTKMFECKYCAKGYNSEEELNSHYSEAHQGPNPFCCAFCPTIFSNSVDLQRHMKFCHPEPGSSVGKLKCEVCVRYFVSKHNLKLHKLKHGDPSLFFKCEICPAVFPLRRSLNDHLKCHVSERKFVCEICGKAYKTMTALKHHSKYHGEKQFPCKFCDKKFFQGNARKIHETITHTNLKDYICQVCGRAFNHPGNLKGHLRLHASKGEM